MKSNKKFVSLKQSHQHPAQDPSSTSPELQQSAEKYNELKGDWIKSAQVIRSRIINELEKSQEHTGIQSTASTPASATAKDSHNVSPMQIPSQVLSKSNTLTSREQWNKVLQAASVIQHLQRKNTKEILQHVNQLKMSSQSGSGNSCYKGQRRWLSKSKLLGMVLIGAIVFSVIMVLVMWLLQQNEKSKLSTPIPIPVTVSFTDVPTTEPPLGESYSK